MISPPGWMLKRPGILIPVFFLSLVYGPVIGQVQWPGTAAAALGNSYVCRQGYMCTIQNQAGLGFIEQSSISIQHGRPYLLKELGISSISGQFISGQSPSILSTLPELVLPWDFKSGYRSIGYWEPGFFILLPGIANLIYPRKTL